MIIDDSESIHDDFRKILSPDDILPSEKIKRAALSLTETQLFGHPLNAATVRQAHFELASAYQGEQGVEMVKKALEEKRPYAVAFVDMRMPPGWDGMITTQKIWEVDPEIQIVICTAYSDYSWNEVFERIGTSDRMVILKKPFDPVEALQLAHDLTKKWHLIHFDPKKTNPKR